jgi:carbamoyltransferase
MILEHTGFANLHLPSAPADDGNAIGSALLAYKRYGGTLRSRSHPHTPYLGSAIPPRSLETLAKFGPRGKWRYLPGTVHKEAAAILAQGKIIGWMQGRAEFGPRALGNRSILADPRPPGMKDRINAEVKFREEFRPFAPSILHEWGPRYFDNYQESPYMERTLRFRLEVTSTVPAVVHADGTGRVHSVRRETNARFYALIEEFHTHTRIPLLLNTSFNVMGKPIIHSVEDALGVFYTSGLDALVIEDYLLEK